MAKSPKILVFIPAYRCAPQIGRVIAQFTPTVQVLVDTVLVVDNRSPDETQQKAIQATLALTSCTAIVWENEGNYGLGGSHKVAFNYAIENSFDYVVVLHGDDQGSIADALDILTGLKDVEQSWDCMLGARFHPRSRISGYSKFRTFGNLVYDWIFTIATGTRIYDLGSGLNVYKVSSLREIPLSFLPDDLTFNYGLLLASISRGQQNRFFPISWREDDQISNVKLFSQALRVLIILFSYLRSRSAFPISDMRSVPIAKYSGKIINSRGPTSSTGQQR